VARRSAGFHFASCPSAPDRFAVRMIEGAVICAAAMKISGDSTFRVSGVISVVIQDSVTTPGLAGVLDVRLDVGLT
jgi:hypothetical protein